MNNTKRTRLDELKIKAALLLKNLNGNEDAKAQKAANRFLALPFLKFKDAGGILNDKSFFRLKHALAVIAIENDCASWNALRAKVIKEDCLFVNPSPAFLNSWFNNYKAAKDHQLVHGGYLLQYCKDFAVCPQGFIDSIGLGDMDKEWKAIGYDWVNPADKAAWDKIYSRAKQNYLDKTRYAVPPPVINKANRPAWLSN